MRKQENQSKTTVLILERDDVELVALVRSSKILDITEDRATEFAEGFHIAYERKRKVEDYFRVIDVQY